MAGQRKNPRRVTSTYPVVCGQCCNLADQEALMSALARGTAYVHDCGAVMVKPRGERRIP